MRINTTGPFKIIRLAVLAALVLILLGGFTGCTEETPDSANNQEDIGLDTDNNQQSDVGVCVPGTRGPDDDCNTCKCNDEGKWSCTTAMCVVDAGPDAEADAN